MKETWGHDMSNGAGFLDKTQGLKTIRKQTVQPSTASRPSHCLPCAACASKHWQKCSSPEKLGVRGSPTISTSTLLPRTTILRQPHSTHTSRRPPAFEMVASSSPDAKADCRKEQKEDTKTA